MSKHIVIYSDDPELGGVAQYNHAIILALLAAGHRVTSVQSYSKGPLVTEQSARGAEHAWISYDTKTDFLRSLSDARDAERILGEITPDLIYFSDCCPLSSMAAKHVAISMRVPFVVIVHAVAAYLAENFKVCLPLLAQQYERAAGILVVANASKELLVKHFNAQASKVKVIYNGRGPSYFAPRSEVTRKRLRTEMCIPPQALVCLTAARLDLAKGIQHLIGAALRLRQTQSLERLVFVIAGDGDQRGALEALVNQEGLAPHFRFLGQRWDMCDLYDAADAFALPSHFESMPLSILEAMAKGLPIIASNVGGIPEELANTGCLIPAPGTDAAGAENAIAKQLEEWSADEELRQRAGAACHDRAVEHFQESHMAQHTLHYLEEMRSGWVRGPSPGKKITPSITRGLLTLVGKKSGELSLEQLSTQVRELALKGVAELPEVPEYHTRSAVCMLVFNRPKQTQRVFEAVRRAKPPRLLLVADGPRPERAAEQALCEQVRSIVGNVDWPCQVQCNFAPTNLGCTRRVVSGLDWVFKEVEECIILEDDCLPSPDFFRFCDEMLERHRENPRIRCISGNSYQYGLHRNEASYFYTPHILIWGWASWRRAWKDNDVSMSQWPALKARRWLASIFADPVAQAYWTNAFDQAAAGRTAWDCPWLFSCWAKGGLGICPEADLIENIGFDAQATGSIANVHPIFIKLYGNVPQGRLPETLKHPSSTAVDLKGAMFIQRFLYEQNWPLMRRELAAYLLTLDDAAFGRYALNMGAQGLNKMLTGGLERLATGEEDEPLIKRCADSLRQKKQRLGALLASLLFFGA